MNYTKGTVVVVFLTIWALKAPAITICIVVIFFLSAFVVIFFDRFRF